MLSCLLSVRFLPCRNIPLNWKGLAHNHCIRWPSDCRNGILKKAKYNSICSNNQSISYIYRKFCHSLLKQRKCMYYLTIFCGVGSGTLLTLEYIRDKAHVSCEIDEKTRSRLFGRNEKDKKEIEPEFDWNRFLHFLKPEAWYLLSAVISAVIVAVLNVQIPVLLGDVINVVSTLMRATTEHSCFKEFLKEIKDPALKLLKLFLVQSLFTFIYISTLSYSGERLAGNMRKALFATIVKQDITFFDSHKTGEIISRLTSDVQDFKSSFKLCLSHGLKSLTQVAGCVISLYLISPKMTALMITVVPAVVISGTFVGSKLRKMSKNAQAQLAHAAAVADEAIGNVRTVRAFSMEDKEIELYDQEITEAENLNMMLGAGIGIFQGATNFVLNGIVLGVLLAGGSLLSTQEITPGSLMSFLVATQTIQRSLVQLSLLFGQFIRGLASGSRVFQYMNLKSKLPLNEGEEIPLAELKGEVYFDNVTFWYPTRPYQMVLRDFSLRLPQGKIVALCGMSGGGKSTVAALVERFYDVSIGSIKLDGHDIKTLNSSWLRGKVIGYISQEPVLFATSIKENIRYGRPDATDEEVVIAAKMANADDFICSFSQGYDTVLGERGVTVSGGQKQRIAIARALLKDPKILILDEATSALDAESEKAVQDALDRVMKGRTVLVIAHRLSTIQNADIIAVLSHGVVAEMGPHKSLMKKRGLYWELIQQQHQEEIYEHTNPRDRSHRS